MTEPRDEMAPGTAGGGRLRASHADREQVIDVLKAAFVQARLTKDEFDARVGQALTSRTHAELAVVIADIPAEPTGVQPPRHCVQARARQPVNPDLKADVRAIITACPIAVVSWLATVLISDNPATMPLYLLAFVATVATLRSGLHGAMVLVESWLQKRSGWQPLPPPPEPGEWLSRVKTGSARPRQIVVDGQPFHPDLGSAPPYLAAWLAHGVGLGYLTVGAEPGRPGHAAVRPRTPSPSKQLTCNGADGGRNPQSPALGVTGCSDGARVLFAF